MFSNDSINRVTTSKNVIQQTENADRQVSHKQLDSKSVVPTTRMKHSTIKVIITLTIGMILLVLGIIAAAFWSSIFNWFLLRELTLTPSSTIYNLWKETPIPMYLKFYFFNWSNPHIFDEPSIKKPIFTEMGPYVFREVDYKVNQVWNDNGTVTFQRRKVWHFEEDLSNGKLTDLVTNVDPVVATVGSMMKNQTELAQDFANVLMTGIGKKVYITKSVDELLFTGYDDRLLGIAAKLNISTIPFTKFGWFYGRNSSDTYDGTFNMLTGENDISQMGTVKEWNFESQTNYYRNSCGIVGGSNGDLWPPLKNNDTVSIFVPDICTYVTLTYQNDSLFQGLSGSKFTSDETMLDNGDIVKSRKCYCMTDECEPAGVLNVSKCKYGAPAFISAPHFYLADDSYRKAIIGMSPSREKHETFVTIEPITGVPMQVKAQLQLNLLLEPVEYMGMFKHVRKTYTPMLWFTQQADLTPEYANQIKFLLTLPILGLVTLIGIAAIGLIVSFIGIFIWVRRKWQGEDNQALISRNDTNHVDRVTG